MQIPEPPISEPRGEPIDACPCCNVKYLSNYTQWFDCEACSRQVCQGCAIERDGHTLCKDDKEAPCCPECGSYKIRSVPISWQDQESYWEETASECQHCLHFFKGEDENDSTL